jgi:hypothetical protein
VPLWRLVSGRCVAPSPRGGHARPRCADGFRALELRELAPGGTLVSAFVLGCRARDATACARPREFDVAGFLAMEDVG